MSITNEIQRVIDSIQSPEVKTSASEAALLMCTAKDPGLKKAATQTYIALARFGSVLDHTPKVNAKRGDTLEETGDEDLKTMVSKSGLAYFGPMFKSEGEYTSLKDAEVMLEELGESGYDIVSLRHLTHPQLDMLFTKILESGIIANPTETLPIEG